MARLISSFLVVLLLAALISNSNAAITGRDIVWQWHEYFATFMTPGPFLSEFREAALLHLAATDAVNSQTNLYTTFYTYNGAGGSPNANSLNLPHLRAIAVGAYRRMFILNTQSRPAAYGAQAGAKFWNSTQQANMIAGANSLYASQINQFPNPVSARVNNSLDYGDQVANWVYSRRVNDGFLLNGTYMGCNRLTSQCLGQWWTPFPNGVPWAQWANVTLFSGKAKGFYRAPRPSYNLKVTNNSMQVTMQYGQNVSAVRTAAQAQVARYFVFSSQPMMLPQVIKMYSEQQDIKISALTRILALFSITQQDAGVVHLENKFFYNLWRPWHHLNYPQSLNYDTDYFNNNINTPNGNLAWIPYMTTPPNPEYPAGHPMMTASGAQVIRRIFGDSTFPVTVGINFNGLITGEPFTDFFYNSLYEYEHEVVMARVWGGMHTHVSCVKGQQLGHVVANDIVDSILLPTGVASTFSEDD